MAAFQAAAASTNFEFVVIGDTRPRFESESFREFERLIPKINAFKPALVINLGDLIYGYGPIPKERQWERYNRVARTIEPPYFQVPGNHDTHSREARRIYGRRFGVFYRSFDYGDSHFVLLDNTEAQRWGYMSPAELDWLRSDLKQTQARAVFVFMHFPVWEPERITQEYYDVWSRTLHPLFKASRVRGVFAGHYHAYGPTREFDGIRYFITGGGGAELRPEYKRSGGDFHFMRVKVSDGNYDVRVVTEQGELTDSEADVMGGLQFAAKNVSRIGIKADAPRLQAGIPFTIWVENPHSEPLNGSAEWVFDASAFSVEPAKVLLQVPAGEARTLSFKVKGRREGATLASLPRLEFNVRVGMQRHRFRREMRFIHELDSPYQKVGLVSSQRSGFQDDPALKLGEDGPTQAELRSFYDVRDLHLSLAVPTFDAEESKELGFTDEVQIGFARRLSATDFGRVALRLGINSETKMATERTPNRPAGNPIKGTKTSARKEGKNTVYELTVPLKVLKKLGIGPGSRFVIDLSFPLPDEDETAAPPDPKVNTMSYRIRYGSDSLVPVHFVEINLSRGSR